MEPKKIVILVILLVALVFMGRFACNKWERLHPVAVSYYDYQYTSGKAPMKGGKAPMKKGGQMPADATQAPDAPQE